MRSCFKLMEKKILNFKGVCIKSACELITWEWYSNFQSNHLPTR